MIQKSQLITIQSRSTAIFAKSLAVVLMIAASSAVPAPAAEKQPNVLFIVCDDLNNHVSTQGYKHIKTPSFDKLAGSGIRFTRAYCQYPVCGPSRASFLSGMYPESTGILNNYGDIREVRPGTQSMPLHFKNAGYWTARTGKIFHNAKTNPPEGWDANPERFTNDEMPMEKKAREAFEAKHGSIRGKNRKAWLAVLGTLGTQTIPKQRKGMNRPYGPSGLTDDQHMDGKNALEVISHLENRPYGDRPFFIACGIHKPHIPFLAPDKYFDMYPQEDLKFAEPPKDFWDTVPKLARNNNYKAYGFKLGPQDPKERRKFIQAYHACITFLDTQIGRIFDALERTNQWDNTIVVLISDHGYQLGEHFMWGKVSLFEHVARVPMVVRVPEALSKGIAKPGSQSEGLVELIDLFPTLVDLCELERPADLQGQSLVPLLRDPAASGKDSAYTVVNRGTRKKLRLGHAIRTSEWRYARWPDGEELYNIKKDPMEWKNLAKSPEYTQQMVTMRALMTRARERAVAKRKPAQVTSE